MKVDIHLLTNQLLSRKLPAFKSSCFISNRATHHRQFDFQLLSRCLFYHFENIPIQDVRNLSNKVVLSINKSQNLGIPTVDAKVLLFSFGLSSQIFISVERLGILCQSSWVDDSPAIPEDHEFDWLFDLSHNLKSFSDKVINGSFAIDFQLGVIQEQFPCRFLGKASK